MTRRTRRKADEPLPVASGWEVIGRDTLESFSAVGTATLLGSNLLWAERPPVDARSLHHAAMSHNAGRTVTTSAPSLEQFVQLPMPLDTQEARRQQALYVPLQPLSSAALRVICVLCGLWVANNSHPCQPQSGTHAMGCAHGGNLVRVEPRALAEACFGTTGGRQTELLRDALDELYDEDTQFLTYNPRTGGWSAGRSRILAEQRLRRSHEDAPVFLEVRFAPALHDDLMAGRYQSFPVEIVQRLSKTALQLAVAILVHPQMAKLKEAGESFSLAVTGRTPVSLPPARLGLAGQARRPARLRQSLEEAAAGVTTVFAGALGVSVTTEDRRQGGLMVTVRRSSKRVSLRSGTSGHEARTSGHEARTSGRDLSTNHDAQTRILQTRESRRGDSTSSPRSLPEGSLQSSSVPMRPDVQALEEIWNRRSSSRSRRLTGDPLRRRSVTEKQLGLLDEWARRHDGYEWAARLFRDVPSGTDPLRWAKDADRKWKHDRRQSASQEDELQAARAEQALADRYLDSERLSTLQRSVASHAAEWEDEEQELDEWGLPVEEIVDLGPRFESRSRDPQPPAVAPSSLREILGTQGLDETLFHQKPKRRKRSASEDPAE